MRLVVVVLAGLVAGAAGSACDPEGGAGLGVDASIADAAPGVAPGVAVDAADGADGAGVADGSLAAADAAPAASEADAAPAAGPDATPAGCTAPCVAGGPCVTAACVDGACVESAVVDGAACAGASVCVAGACVVAGCGDGWRDPAGEACDDGNQTDGDACSAACTPTVMRLGGDDVGTAQPAGRRALAIDARGFVAAAWVERTAPRAYRVLVARATPSGVPEGEPAVLIDGLADAGEADVTLLGRHEGWVVAWIARSPMTSWLQVHLKVLHPDGSFGPEVVVVDGLPWDARDLAIASGRDAEVWLAWTVRATPARVVVQGYSETLAPLSEPIVVSSGDAASSRPAIARVGDVLVIAWNHTHLAGQTEVRARCLALGASPILGATTIVASDGPGTIHADPVVRREDAEAVVAWTSFAVDAAGDAMLARISPVDCTVWGAIPLAAQPSVAERALEVLGLDGITLAAIAHPGAAGQTGGASLVTAPTVDGTEFIGIEALRARLQSHTGVRRLALAGTPGRIWALWGEADGPVGGASSVYVFAVTRSP